MQADSLVYFSTAIWYILVQQSELHKFSVPNLYAFVCVYLFISECLISSIYLHLPICPYIYTCLYIYSVCVCVCVCVCVFLDFSIYPDSYEEIFFLPPQNSCKLGYHHGFRSLTNLVRTLTLSKKTTIFVSSKHITKRTQTFSMS